MKHRKIQFSTRFTGLFFCACISLTAHSGDWQTSLLVNTQWSADTHDTNNQNWQLSLEPEAILRFDNGMKLTTLGRLLSISHDALAPQHISLDTYSAASQPLYIGNTGKLELREFYLEIPTENYYFTLGKQQVSWGKTDGLKVLDIVNPQSFRAFILEDFDDSRIPQWMVNIETTIGEWDAQALWIPDQSYHALPDSEAYYTFTSNQFAPKPPAGVTVKQNAVKRPGSIIKDSDFGLRFSRFWMGWDLSLNYLYQYDNTALFYRQLNITPAGAVITLMPQLRRTHVFGGSFSNAFGSWVMRGELAYYTKRYYLTDGMTDSDGITRGSETSYVLGLDWSGLENTLLSLQFFQSVATKRDAATLRDKTDTSFSLLLNHTLLNETMEVQMVWLGSANAGDGLVRFKTSYEWQDNVEFWLASDTFYGNDQGLYGQFNDKDRITFGIEFSF